MSEHAFLPPSGASTWVKCHAAPLMWREFPSVETVESREGTAAHWAWAELFEGREIDVGLVAPNGVVLTDEMCRGARMYVAVVQDVVFKAAEKVVVNPVHEKTMPIPRVHSGNWGTPDTWIDARHWNNTIYLFDYKFGHKYVEVFENWQLIDYAAGIMDELGIDGAQDQHTFFEFVIVQPRNYHRDGPIRKMRLRASELRGPINILRMAADQATGPDPSYTVNEECRYCSARHACQPYQREAHNAAKLSQQSTPLELPPDAAGRELTMLTAAAAALNGRIDGLRDQVEQALNSGQSVPGWTINHPPGRLGWSVPVAQVKAMGQMFGIPLIEEKPITPTQAIDKGIPEALIGTVAKRASGKATLEPEDLTQARKAFAK